MELSGSFGIFVSNKAYVFQKPKPKAMFFGGAGQWSGRAGPEFSHEN